ncbi:MAG: hypothetical protein H8K07_05815 [Nitrospira sp.]|jgi:hypothetical protein|nr:hypothetical protein [Nitrospira sp.]MDI3461643.1 hypothetical protein [Nitrospira sp.]
MPAGRIVTEEGIPSVPTTVHTSATRTWTLSGDYGTARKDRHMADPARGA